MPQEEVVSFIFRNLVSAGTDLLDMIGTLVHVFFLIRYVLPFRR